MVRDTRKLPEPTKEIKQKHIPVKYQNKAKVGIVQKIHINKEIKIKTQYALAEIETYQDDNVQQTYWIKYKNKKDFNRQLDILLQYYKIQTYDIIDHGIKYYKPFIDTGFQEKLDTWNIKV